MLQGCEMIRNILWAATLVVTLGIAYGAAHMFRYTPLDEDAHFIDRWTQEVCGLTTETKGGFVCISLNERFVIEPEPKAEFVPIEPKPKRKLEFVPIK